MSDLFVKSGATISDCGSYRYHLWRIWEDTLPILVWVMLNPSTADASQDDPTIRRCLGFARKEGYGGISVRNVFALRVTDPRKLLAHPDPVGPENAQALADARRLGLIQTRMVAAWGNRVGGERLRNAYCNASNACWMNNAYCFGFTKQGDPRHPLYLPGNAAMVPWKSPGY